MSPEQRAGQTIAPAMDVWSLGAVLHEALTGRRPEERSRRSLRRLRKAPGDLEVLVATMLEDDPDRRPTMTSALRRLSAIEPCPSRGWAPAIARNQLQVTTPPACSDRQH
jgi:serine/threonine protein kinase